MFDDDHRRAIRYKFIKHVQQHANIKRMQADCRLIEHEYRIMLFPAPSRWPISNAGPHRPTAPGVGCSPNAR